MDTTHALADLHLTEQPGGVTLAIRAVPRAGRNALDGVVEGALRVRLVAPPVEGAANKALIAFMADLLAVPKRDIAVVSGERGRHKLIRVEGLTADAVRVRLGIALTSPSTDGTPLPDLGEGKILPKR